MGVSRLQLLSAEPSTGVTLKDSWEQDARRLDEYHVVEARRGREFILRMTTGADIYKGVQKFAKDKKIRFAKIHCAFMGGLKPTRYLMWTPDTRDLGNWHNETPATVENLSMILAMGGVIHPRIVKGKEEPFPAIHFVAGELGMPQRSAGISRRAQL